MTAPTRDELVRMAWDRFRSRAKLPFEEPKQWEELAPEVRRAFWVALECFTADVRANSPEPDQTKPPSSALHVRVEAEAKGSAFALFVLVEALSEIRARAKLGVADSGWYAGRADAGIDEAREALR